MSTRALIGKENEDLEFLLSLGEFSTIMTKAEMDDFIHFCENTLHCDPKKDKEFIKHNSGDLSEKDADMVKADIVERIVDEGDLDSNISYNQNIDNFIEEAMFLIEQKNKPQDKSDKVDINK